MRGRSLRRGGGELSPWPGYVDALSTLLMVIIFVLLVFVLAQAFLSVTLSGRDQALERLNRQVAALADSLALERGHAADLALSVATLTRDLAAATSARNALAGQLAAATARAGQLDEGRAALQAERDRLAAELADSKAQLAAAGRSREALQQQVTDLAGRNDASGQKAVALAAQIAALRAQLAQLTQALDASQAAAKEKDLQITSLGQRLNAALASKVEELQRYRSEFFGRLREVLAGRPGIQVVGDRFVFQSEVLFPSGSAELSPEGSEQIHQLAQTLRQLIPEIPPGINWILRVDGHADHQPAHGAWTSNWELSAARAITVVKQLIADGVPASHLAATGFADYQPLDTAETPAAYARNRRIELRLTDR